MNSYSFEIDAVTSVEIYERISSIFTKRSMAAHYSKHNMQ